MSGTQEPTAESSLRSAKYKNAEERKAAVRKRAETALGIAVAERARLLEEGITPLATSQRVLRALRVE